ncbi:MAG: hypothetical protein JW755_05645 [Candidatus Aminicenantes bacterium]|nr:hypothetical protein [Candidatus Aminicenantes bacterium]
MKSKIILIFLITGVMLLINFSTRGFNLDKPLSPQKETKRSQGLSGQKRSRQEGKSANQMFSQQTLRQVMNYLAFPIGGSWEALPFTLEDVNNAELPDNLDWRELDGVTPIDIQPDWGCGGCWVYAATAVFESLIKIRTGREVDLSEEQISSCLPNGNHTGIAWQAFNFMQYNGVTTEEYIPCNFDFPVCDYPVNLDTFFLHEHWILSMYEIPLAERIKIIKYVLQNYGPVATGFIVYSDWGNYQSGVYIHDDVSPYSGHHSIALVGWGDDAALPTGGYWIVKNDFGEEWGEDGFFRIGYGECEIDMAIMFARWDPDILEPIFALKVGNRYFYAGDDIRLDISARGPDGQIISYMAVGLPPGAIYDPNTGIFTWLPDESQIGSYEIEFIAYYDDYYSQQTGVIHIISGH